MRDIKRGRSAFGSDASAEWLFRKQVLSYVTENPKTWPDEVDQIIRSPGLQKIGIGIRVEVSQTHLPTKFWITLIFDVSSTEEIYFLLTESRFWMYYEA